MRNRVRGLIVILCLLSCLPAPAGAQNGSGAALSAPNIDDFPTIRAYLKVFDGQGRFVDALQAEQVTILEDGSPRPVDRLDLLRPGVQFVAAINPGPSFAIRNAQAVSRYDLLKEALRAWALSRSGSTLDNYSLLITGGPAASHTPSATQWLGALQSDTIDPRQAIPSLDTLSRAISLASDPTDRPGMGRMVLFITPPPETQADPQIYENLAAQANSAGIPITIWLVSSSGAFTTQGVQQLQQLAAMTGGQFFTFTGEETLPDLEVYLEPQRLIYQLGYTSAVTTEGLHQITAQIRLGEASVDTQPASFEIRLQPPQPALVQPPTQVLRRPAALATPGPGAAQSEAMLAPEALEIQVIFDFPDGRPRPLAYSALLVDGQVVDENTQPPFDRFRWPLDEYTGSAEHRLQVQARDALGLSGSSIETPIMISVEQPSSSPMARFQNSLPVIAMLVALVAGALLFLVMVMGGRLRPRAQRAAARRSRADPVTQPVHIPNEPAPHRRPGWVSRLQGAGRQPAAGAEAYLNPLPDTADDQTILPIPVPLDGLVFGSDPASAGLLLDDRSIEKLHAVLTRLEDGSYRLADQGSVAGTWINYTPVSREGARLEHGDLVHIGRIGFRFTLRKPTNPRRPVIVSSAPADFARQEDEPEGPSAEPPTPDPLPEESQP
ncbi:MAG: FHA domain-containing protein [Chloroflexota bacterium]